MARAGICFPSRGREDLQTISQPRERNAEVPCGKSRQHHHCPLEVLSLILTKASLCPSELSHSLVSWTKEARTASLQSRNRACLAPAEDRTFCLLGPRFFVDS
jgi:hypothetical protein